MATLYISEYSENGFRQLAGLPIAAMPPAVEQTKAIGGASVQSSAFGGQTRVVRLHTDVVCSITFGKDPTASATAMRLPADHTEYFAVQPGDKVAVIANS
ncbi:hypothetical protein [Devosia sp.]|uniref:hypothetical protein n=1 Tax=Devosia sp. TaxID=1871048 RepID=UPI003F701983